MSKIFIVCSASNDIDKDYFNKVKELIAKINDNTLLFGGYNSGIMGLAYHSFKKSIGIAPKLYEKDLNSLNCEKIVTKYTGESTDNLINKSDIILVLPGGVGSLYELCAAIHMNKIGEINKPIIIYNYNGFYNDFLKMMDKLVEEKFAKENIKEFYKVSDNIDEIVGFVESMALCQIVLVEPKTNDK